MRKDRLYFLTFLSIALIFILTASIATKYFIKISTNHFFQTHLEASKREAREVASLVGFQLENGIQKDIVISNVQKSIENTNVENGFICMFDWSGKEICHPDKTRVGQTVSPNQSFVSSIGNDVSPEDFYEVLVHKRAMGGIRNFAGNKEASELIYLHPVANSDWIIGSHANISKISEQLADMRSRFYSVFALMGFVIILGSVLTVRIIGSKYEERLELKTQKLESEVFNLSKLNSDLSMYQQKVITANNNDQQGNEIAESTKKRILTYKRNELLPIAVDEIAYIYTDNAITYVVSAEGKQSTTNKSLDELYSGLNESYFYRANRQFIVAISAIEKIIKYGNNQLKIVVSPDSENHQIVISKNRASEFKNWLNS